MKEYKCENLLKKIKDVTKNKGMTQKELLEKSNLNKNTFDNMKKSMLKSDNLAKVADTLEVSMDYLMDRTENPKINE